MKRIVEFMKRNYKVILLVTALSAILWSFIPREKTEDPEKDKLLLELLTFVLEKGHYSPVEINDDFSKKVYKKYLDNIDPTKRFFIQSDIDEFSKYETSIDDMIKNKDLTFFNLTNARLLKRMSESREIYEDVLSKPFDFTVKESINVDYEKLPFSKNKSELMELKGIGEVIADRIIEYREQNNGFKSLEEIMEVKGIGEKIFSNMQDRITID